jgi:hypothetical protein
MHAQRERERERERDIRPGRSNTGRLHWMCPGPVFDLRGQIQYSPGHIQYIPTMDELILQKMYC